MADTTAQRLPHMSKLRHRNAISVPEIPLSSRNIHNLNLRRDIIYETPTTVSSRASSINTRSSSETTASKAPSLASPSSSARSSHEFKPKKKKKSNSVFSFLSLKEPSQVVLEQDAEQQRKQSGSKTPTSSSITSSFTSKPLPANIPKVNSRWDGIPDRLKSWNSSPSQGSKDRSNTSSWSSRDLQSVSVPWTESRISTSRDGTRNPLSPVALPMTPVLNVSTHGNSPSITLSPASTTITETNGYVPGGDEFVASGALPLESPQIDSLHESVAGLSTESGFEFGPTLSESRLDSPHSSTGSVDTIVRDTAEVVYSKLNYRPHRSLLGDEASTVYSPGGGGSDTVPESHNFLFNIQPTVEQQVKDLPMDSQSVPSYVSPRPVHNFSRPIQSSNTISIPLSPMRPSSYRKVSVSSALPTLYERSLSSAESIKTVQDNSDACSIAPSIARSELSTQWYESPRERLGLGGRIRKNDILPWEKKGHLLGKQKRGPLSMFGIRSIRS